MNVLLANDSFPPLIDGVSNTVFNYASIIEKNYGHAQVAVPSYPNVVDDYPFDVVRYTSIDTVKQFGYRTGYPFSYKAMESMVAFGPDIIHCHCPMASLFLCRELRGIVDKPLIVTYHTKFDMDIQRTIKSHLIQDAAIDMIVNSISTCDEVWTVSKGAGESLKGLGYKGDYLVMPNGVDMTKEPASEKKVLALRKKLHLPEGVPVFLFVGRMIWYKGIRTILEGLRIMKSAGYDFRMIFVGNGENLEEAKELSDSLQLEDKVLFVGPIHDRDVLKTYYTLSDLFLLPSEADTFALVAREAAACSTASLLIENSCAADGVTNDDNGILIPNTPGDLAARLIKLTEHPDKFIELGKRASETIYFSWEQSVKIAYDRYEALLKEKHLSISERPLVKVDRPMELVADSYLAIAKARWAAEGIKSSWIKTLEKNKELNQTTLDYFKKQKEKLKDKFGRYL